MADRTAPVQGHAPIPWSVHEAAWAVYAERFGRYQSAERIAERGGFSVGELDMFRPTWREESDEIPRLRKRIAEQEAQLRDMRRSLQAAEAAIGTTVADCRREGVSMGRKLASASASVLGARVDELESAARAYLAAVDEESGQAIALEALRKALGGSDGR